MKTIRAVDDRPESFDEETPIEVLNKMPTYRKLFKAALGLGAAKDAENAVDLYQIGLKMKLTDADISLEDEEFKTLKEACNKNPAQWIAHYFAQVMLKLKEAEEK